MARPKIVTARSLGLHFQPVFGTLGPEKYVTGHHSAGPQPKSWNEALRLIYSYHRYHKSKGWGGLGYHYVIIPSGTIICARPTWMKGAHVGGHNSRNIGVMFPGTTGHCPTAAQSISYRYLLRYAHTSRFPKAHRTDENLRGAVRKGHNDWSGHRWNACPGTHKHLIVKGYRDKRCR